MSSPATSVVMSRCTTHAMEQRCAWHGAHRTSLPMALSKNPQNPHGVGFRTFRMILNIFDRVYCETSTTDLHNVSTTWLKSPEERGQH
eukprot:505518-Amphidinium_carterae.1